jgi:hypothetical protein
MGTRGNAKKGKTQREIWIDGVRRIMTNHGLTEEDIRDRDRWRNLVLGEGKPLYTGQTLDDDDHHTKSINTNCRVNDCKSSWYIQLPLVLKV